MAKKVTKKATKTTAKTKPAYVDGFVLLVPVKKLAAYKKIATIASKVWLDHGALQYVETVGDDLDLPFGLPFTKLAKPKKGEAVVFAWITYASKVDRYRVNAAVMTDKRLDKLMDPKKMPFDMKRMSCGGFKVMVAV